MTAVSSSTTAPSKAPSVYYPEPEKCALRRLRRRRRALRRHRFGDRNLQAERRRSARLSCYVDGHDMELWEGIRQVALLTRSNCLFEQRAAFCSCERAAVRRLLRNVQRSGRLSPCARFAPAPSVCEWTGALAPGGFPCCVREGSMSVME